MVDRIRPLAVMAYLSLGAGLSVICEGAPPPQIPVVQCEERSDWVSVKTDVTPAAIGAGQADGTAAIQKALAEVRDGSVLCFPLGNYRITAPPALQAEWFDPRTGARRAAGTVTGGAPRSFACPTPLVRSCHATHGTRAPFLSN